MANMPQQRKRARQDAGKRVQHKIFKGSARTWIKQVERLVKQGDKTAAQEAFHKVNQKLDKAVAKKLYSKNFAARQKSRLQQHINTL